MKEERDGLQVETLPDHDSDDALPRGFARELQAAEPDRDVLAERGDEAVARHAMEARLCRSDQLPDPSPAGHGEDRRYAVRVLGRDQGADQAVSAAGGRLRPRYGRGRRASVQDRHEGQPHRRHHPRRRLDLSSGRDRLRRQVHLGSRGRIPAEQPIHRLPGRSGDHEGGGDVPLCGSCRRRGSRHRQQVPARGQLGLAPVLSLGSRCQRKAHQCERGAGEAADAEHLALSRLPGLQICRRPAACCAPA